MTNPIPEVVNDTSEQTQAFIAKLRANSIKATTRGDAFRADLFTRMADDLQKVLDAETPVTPPSGQ